VIYAPAERVDDDPRFFERIGAVDNVINNENRLIGYTSFDNLTDTVGLSFLSKCASSEHSRQSGRFFSGELASSGVDI
jgi:hypothetical protein